MQVTKMKRAITICLLAVAFLAVVAMFMPGAEAVNRTWTGSTNTAWANGNNWNPTGVPSSSDHVFIPNVANDPVISVDAETNNLRLNASAHLSVDGATLDVNGETYTVSGSEIDLTNNATIVHFRGIVHAYGAVNCSDSTTTVHCHDSFYMHNNYISGLSTIYAEGSGSYYFYQGGATKDYYDFVVNGSSTDARMSAPWSVVKNNLTVADGVFDPYARTTLIRGNLIVDGELEMSRAADEIIVKGDIHFNNGSTTDVSTGVLSCWGEWYIRDTAEMQFTGSHESIMNGSTMTWHTMECHSPDSHFNMLSIEKTGNNVELAGTEPVNVTDDLRIEMSVQNQIFDVYHGGLVVHGDVAVNRGGFEFWGVGVADVMGNVTVATVGKIRFENVGRLNVGRNLTLNGDLFFSHTNGGTTSVDGITWIQNGGQIVYNSQFGEFLAGGAIYLNNTCSIDMSAGNAYLNQTLNSFFYVRDLVNLRNDDARLNIGHMWITGGGHVNCHGYSPEIGVKNHWYDYGTFTHGTSTVTFTETWTFLYNEFAFWNVVVDKLWKMQLSDDTTINGTLVVDGGTLDIYDESLRVNGSGPLNYGGTDYTGLVVLDGAIEMDDAADFIEVNSDVYWGADSTAIITNGTINCTGNWTFASGSDVNLTGRNTVNLNGSVNLVFSGDLDRYLWTNSTSSSFNHLNITGWGTIFGDEVVTWIDGTETVVVDGHLSKFGRGGDVIMGSSAFEVWGNVNISEGLIWLDGPGSIDVHGDLFVYDDIGGVSDDGTLWLGANATKTGEGTVDVAGRFWTSGRVSFRGLGGNLTVAEYLTIASMGGLEFVGTAGNISTHTIYKEGGSGFAIYSNDTTIDVHDLIVNTSMVVGKRKTPTFLISGDFDWAGSLWIEPGHSEFRLDGTGSQTMDSGFTYWGVVIDKPSGDADWDGHIFVESYFAVHRGGFELDNKVLRVYGNGTTADGYSRGTGLFRGFIVEDAYFNMTTANANLWVRTVYLFSGSKGNFSDGQIHCNYYWYVEVGSFINMTGTTTYFDGDPSSFLYVYSPVFSFYRLIIAKDSVYAMTIGSIHTQLVVVKDNLTVNMGGYEDPVNVRGDLFVGGHLEVREGVMHFYDESNTRVKRGMYINGDGSSKFGHAIGGANLDIGGELSIAGYGMHFNDTGGNVTVGCTTWIDSVLGFNAENGNVTTFSTYEIEVNGTGILYVASNETYISTDLDISYSGTIRVEDEAKPRFTVRDDWHSGGGTFQSGMSEVWFEGDLYQYISPERFWIVVINKTDFNAYPSGANLTIKSCLFVLQGVYDAWLHTTHVNMSSPGFLYNGTYYTGFVNYGGVLRMTNTQSVMDINGPTVWGPMSQDDIQDGEMYCNGSWNFTAGSQASLDNITVTFDGNNYDTYFNWVTVQSHSTMSYFTDLVLSRDSGQGVALDHPSTVPLLVEGDIVSSGNFAVLHSTMNVTGSWNQTAGLLMVNTEFWNVVGTTHLFIGGDLYVQSGATLYYQSNYFNSTIECADLVINGTLTVSSMLHQNWLNASGSSVISGIANIFGLGAWNTGGTLTIATGASVYVSGNRYHINASLSVILQSGTNTRLYSDGVHLRAGAYFSLFGTLDCDGFTPEIHVGADWSSSPGATFDPGESTVFFEGTGVSTTIDNTERFHNIHVDIVSRNLTLVTGDISCHDLNLTSGTIELDDHSLTVRNDFFGHDRFEMDGDIWFNVSGNVNWHNGSVADIIRGSCIVSEDLLIDNGADVTYGPSSLLRFNSSRTSRWLNNDPGSDFGDVEINKSSRLYAVRGYTIYMDSLAVNNKGSQLQIHLQTQRIVVDGDLELIRGTLNPHTNSNVTVNGTLTCHNRSFLDLEWTTLNADTLIIDGKMYLNGTSGDVWVGGSAYIPGSEIIWNRVSDMIVLGDMWVNITGIVNMSASSGYLEIFGDLNIYGLVDLSNDYATLTVHGDLQVWPLGGGTLRVRDNAEPDIYLYGHFNGLGPASVFEPGHSVFHLMGPNYQSLEDRFDYWGVVVEKNGSYARFEGNPGNTAHIRSFLVIETGTFNLMDASVMVNSSGSGHSIWPDSFVGFANYGGYFVMSNENGSLDVNGPVYWGDTSTEYITDGDIHVSGNWHIESGALMTLTDKNHVHFDGNESAMYYGYANGSQFRNVTVEKDPTLALTFGGGIMNVTHTLTIDSTAGIDVWNSTLEAFGIVHDDGELNVSGPDGELYVWDTIAMDSTSTLSMSNDSYAYIKDFTGMGTIWLGNRTNLTIVDDLWMPTGTLNPGRSVVHFTGGAATSIDIGGSFHDLTADKSGITQVGLNDETFIEGDLTILMAAFYPQAHNIHIGGDFYCSPSAWFAQASSDPGEVIFNGMKVQYLRSGGTNSNHDFQNITVKGTGTEVRVVDHSMSITDRLTIGSGTEFRFAADNETFYTGSGGVINDGVFRVISDHGPIDFEVYAGSDIINNGSMHLVDASWTRAIHVYSSSPGTQWNLIDNTASKSVPNVFHANVSDSDATGGNTIYAGSGYNHDDGNNDNWVFSARINLWFHDNDGYSMNLTVYRFDSPVTISGTTGIWDWADENRTATLQDEYVITTNEERYYTEDTTSWTVTSEINADVYYYRQWRPSITLDGTDTSHTVGAYYTALGGTTSQSSQHTSWSRWVDNGTALSFDKDASGTPARHTSEDFSASPWDPVGSAFTRTVSYSGNDVPELYNGSMDPSGGNVTTMFNFTVEYWDADNDTPLFVYVNIDGTNYSMDKVDSGDNDYTDGCEYYYETLLSGGDHDYYFICNDSYATNQTSTENTGTIIPEFGILPVMISMMAVGAAISWRRRRKGLR